MPEINFPFDHSNDGGDIPKEPQTEDIVEEAASEPSPGELQADLREEAEAKADDASEVFTEEPTDGEESPQPEGEKSVTIVKLPWLGSRAVQGATEASAKELPSASEPGSEDSPRAEPSSQSEQAEDSETDGASTSEFNETPEFEEWNELPVLGPTIEVEFDWDDLWVDVGEILQGHHLDIWRKEHQADAGEEGVASQEQEPPQEFRDKVKELTGRKGEEVFANLWPDKSQEDRDRMLREFRGMVEESKKTMPAKPIEGAAEAQARLTELKRSLPKGWELRYNILTGRSVGLPETAAAAGVPLDAFDRIRAQGGDYDRYETKTGALKQDVTFGKVPAKHRFIVGDGTGDVSAGRRAGMQSIGIPLHGPDAEALMAAGADRTFANLGQFVDWFTGYVHASIAKSTAK